jgi:hypothetical protein
LDKTGVDFHPAPSFLKRILYYNIREMKTVKFFCDDSCQKQFAAAVRKNVNKYFRENSISIKGNVFLVIQTTTMLSV